MRLGAFVIHLFVFAVVAFVVTLICSAIFTVMFEHRKVKTIWFLISGSLVLALYFSLVMLDIRMNFWVRIGFYIAVAILWVLHVFVGIEKEK